MPKSPRELSHIAGQVTISLANEQLNAQPLLLEPMTFEDAKEQLGTLDMAAERIEILEPVELIHPMMNQNQIQH